jgi:hypothetical protein
MNPHVVRDIRPFSWSRAPLTAHALGLAALLAAALCGGPIGAADAIPSHQWLNVRADQAAARLGSVLLYDADGQRMLLVGPTDTSVSIQAFDLAKKTWNALDITGPTVKGGLRPYYQAAYDPAGKTVYCLSGDAVLYAWRVGSKTWKTHPAAPELEGLSWHTMACDPVGRKLVVVGADKKVDNLGWSRTVVHDIVSGQWSRLEAPDGKVLQQHRQLVAAKEAVVDLAGRIRLTWFRDPKGVGTEVELKSLRERCANLKQMPQAEAFAGQIDALAAQLAAGKTLDALSQAGALLRRVEESAEAQYPVPCSRRNSPLAFDEQNGVFVLFGGDHEDYLMNDTWVLDLRAKSWRRSKVAKAPSPRAGHALCGLSKSGGVVLYERLRAIVQLRLRGDPLRAARSAATLALRPQGRSLDLVGGLATPWQGRPQHARAVGYLRRLREPVVLPAGAGSRRQRHTRSGGPRLQSVELEVEATR